MSFYCFSEKITPHLLTKKAHPHTYLELKDVYLGAMIRPRSFCESVIYFYVYTIYPLQLVVTEQLQGHHLLTQSVTCPLRVAHNLFSLQ